MVDATCDETKILDFQPGGGDALDNDKEANEDDEPIQKNPMFDKTLNE